MASQRNEENERKRGPARSHLDEGLFSAAAFVVAFVAVDIIFFIIVVVVVVVDRRADAETTASNEEESRLFSFLF